jgi:ribosomal protein S18 acetylase RimI-like enzyme
MKLSSMVERMNISRVTSENLVRSCRKFLMRDSVANVLPLGDLYSPLFSVSDVYCATESNRVVGVCSIYRAFRTPSVVLGHAKPETKQALVKRAMREITGDFISLSHLEDTGLFDEHATIIQSWFEQQLVATEPTIVKRSSFEVMKVGNNELEPLNDFYMQHDAEAWTPIQFQVGPYYCVKQQGQIVSAAGVHIVTPRIAQLGNIVTDEQWRDRGFGTACTSALAADLASKGRIVSLFVRRDNDPAIHVYETLGFRRTRDIAFLAMRKNVLCSRKKGGAGDCGDLAKSL